MTYDAAGERTVVDDNFGGVTTNVYDADGNLTQQLFGGTGQTPMRIDLTYNADDELTSEIRYSDLAGTDTVATTTLTYDAAGELTNQLDKAGGRHVDRELHLDLRRRRRIDQRDAQRRHADQLYV